MIAKDYYDTKNCKLFNQFLHFLKCSNQTSITSVRSKIFSFCKKYFEANPVQIHSFIHSGYFYSASSSPLPFRGAPDYSTDTVSEFHAEANRQLQVNDLPKVPTWRNNSNNNN